MGGDARVRLDALEQAALLDAQEHARAIRSAAEARAQALIAAAQAGADALLAEERVKAERLAEVEERRQLALARADAHVLVLHAQRSVLSEARDAAHSAAQALREDPRYTRLLALLAAQARARLTSAGAVQVASTPDGGLIARAGSLQIDHSLHAQVERCLRGLSGELQRLWL